MSRISYAIAAVVLTVTLAGCGGAAPDDGHVEFHGTTSPVIDGFKDNMSKDLKGKTYLKKPKEPEKKAAAATPAEK